jgi:hypothetical protein
MSQVNAQALKHDRGYFRQFVAAKEHRKWPIELSKLKTK